MYKTTQSPEYKWLNQDGSIVDMHDLNDKDLQTKFIHACISEFKASQRLSLYGDLVRQLQEVAQERGIRLLFPDEKFPTHGFGSYFKGTRKVLEIIEIKEGGS